jgi:SAM-dependent methyltransferase
MADTAVKHDPGSLASRIVSYSLHDPKHPEIELSQAEHRIRLVNAWKIQPGDRLLELGCGQGNTTAVLADAVSSSGHIDAVDPGALDYGTPFTLAQAQNHLSASLVGERITWHQADPVQFLKTTEDKWDIAILSHCIWYFASEQDLAAMLTSFKGRVNRICIAEYSLHATHPAALPHVLAVLARGCLESCRPKTSQNVRSPMSPTTIKEIAAKSGWSFIEEARLTPDVGLLDGSWETGAVIRESFLRDVEENVQTASYRTVIRSARDATLQAVDDLKGAQVRTMDVWVSSFGLTSSSE